MKVDSLRQQTKLCAVCQRPFQWRKKWQQCWQQVRYCSERCRRQRHLVAATKESSHRDPHR
ncbi:DUF2256 domain-containing protein [Ferrimonas senticii]|uniref:DUF2256 domain-containing protein n=1 Tax=Ferrimonas senticii TaxID=394566 RepID=UPI0003F60868|nr:DUF2256 domain-containing protein [Ferrimonas senticii]